VCIAPQKLTGVARFVRFSLWKSTAATINFDVAAMQATVGDAVFDLQNEVRDQLFNLSNFDGGSVFIE